MSLNSMKSFAPTVAALTALSAAPNYANAQTVPDNSIAQPFHMDRNPLEDGDVMAQDVQWQPDSVSSNVTKDVPRSVDGRTLTIQLTPNANFTVRGRCPAMLDISDARVEPMMMSSRKQLVPYKGGDGADAAPATREDRDDRPQNAILIETEIPEGFSDGSFLVRGQMPAWPEQETRIVVRCYWDNDQKHEDLTLVAQSVEPGQMPRSSRQGRRYPRVKKPQGRMEARNISPTDIVDGQANRIAAGVMAILPQATESEPLLGAQIEYNLALTRALLLSVSFAYMSTQGAAAITTPADIDTMSPELVENLFVNFTSFRIAAGIVWEYPLSERVWFRTALQFALATSSDTTAPDDTAIKGGTGLVLVAEPFGIDFQVGGPKDEYLKHLRLFVSGLFQGWPEAHSSFNTQIAAVGGARITFGNE